MPVLGALKSEMLKFLLKEGVFPSTLTLLGHSLLNLDQLHLCPVFIHPPPKKKKKKKKTFGDGLFNSCFMQSLWVVA